MPLTDLTPARRRPVFEAIKPFLVFAAVFGGWFVLNRWVLPKFGVAT